MTKPVFRDNLLYFEYNCTGGALYVRIEFQVYHADGSILYLAAQMTWENPHRKYNDL